MGEAVAQPGTTHLGLVAFAGRFDQTAMAGLREGEGYVGAQPSRYLHPA